MVAANVKLFLCVAQYREYLDKTMRYGAHMTYAGSMRDWLLHSAGAF
jgi:hypothetical protein